MHVSIHVIVTGVLCNRAQVRFLLSLFGIFTLKIEKKNPTFMNISWAEMSRNLEISSKCSVEAIKNTTLCKFHKVYKEFGTMGSNAPVWTASLITLVDHWLDPGSPGGFRQTLLQVQSPKKFFCHSNIPTRRRASALWALQSCFYALFIRNFCSVWDQFRWKKNMKLL